MKTVSMVIEMPEMCRTEVMDCIEWFSTPKRRLSSSGTAMVISDPGQKKEPRFGMRIISMKVMKEEK